MIKRLYAFDIIILAYIGIISLLCLIFAYRMPNTLVYLAYHAAVVVMILLILYAHDRFGGRFWRALRYSYIVVAVLGGFREIHYIVPEMHPFEWEWDLRLNAIDVAMFGDVGSWLRSLLWRPMVDFLSICYWTYYPIPVLIGVLLARRGEYTNLRSALTVALFALFLSFFGYFLIPAVGPHLLESEYLGVARDAEWDGVLLSAALHKLLLKMEWKTPDAFPSGHTLMAMLFIMLAWKYRTAKWTVTIFSVGIVLATVYLRYHYIIDVLTSLALTPFCWYVAWWIDRVWHKGAPAREETGEA